MKGAVPRVVVADSRMLVDNPGAGVEAVVGKAHRHEYGSCSPTSSVSKIAPICLTMFFSLEAAMREMASDSGMPISPPICRKGSSTIGKEDWMMLRSVRSVWSISRAARAVPGGLRGHRLNWLQPSMAG